MGNKQHGAGQAKVSRDIERKIKKASSISEETKDKKLKQQKLFYYTKLIHKNNS